MVSHYLPSPADLAALVGGALLTETLEPRTEA